MQSGQQTLPAVSPPDNLDQSALSDVRLLPPPGELDKNIHVVFDSGIFPHYVNTRLDPQNRKYKTHRIAVRGRPSHDHR